MTQQSTSTSAVLISTPGGFRKQSFVHILGAHQAVLKRGGVSHLMDMRTAALVEGAADQSSPAVTQTGGWVTWANWLNNGAASISSFATTWVVPPAPATQSGQLIYLFNGLQDPAGSEILQPVLQWGVSGAGGGNFWSVASWHVDSNGHAFCTAAIQVQTGDTLVGLITENAILTGGTRNYECQFQGIAGTSLMALGMVVLPAAEQTLEAYSVTQAGDYPAAASTAMTQINIQTGGAAATVNWTPMTMQTPLYGEHTVVVKDPSPGEVDLYY